MRKPTISRSRQLTESPQRHVIRSDRSVQLPNRSISTSPRAAHFLRNWGDDVLHVTDNMHTLRCGMRKPNDFATVRSRLDNAESKLDLDRPQSQRSLPTSNIPRAITHEKFHAREHPPSKRSRRGSTVSTLELPASGSRAARTTQTAEASRSSSNTLGWIDNVESRVVKSKPAGQSRGPPGRERRQFCRCSRA